ncbi:hypothetical protein [Streptomyces sp. UNOC14_S4]|uniref:hypothetical protein n=1 Tax=Streptomyces sp. UNOC14_S4 TaxID=2872340 RepID=UPI001E2CCCD0|nr:hypothetical protein [Streptomyces sp. UNOC14_S4]MCC3767644.1 hypothetical protein [Streptomyces sp. UNOC14_S4]
MRVAVASAPGTEQDVNEDAAFTGPHAAIVLDGVSEPPSSPSGGSCGASSGCAHGTPWYVHHLGSRLLDLSADSSRSLSEALFQAIADVAALHRATCAPGPPWAPAATVAMIRRRGGLLDHLVLSDSSLVLDLGDTGIRVITDTTLDDLARTHLRAALADGTPADPAALVARLTELHRQLRNRSDGYWIASTVPEAAHHALTGTCRISTVHRAALLTDGASRLVDTFRLLTWAQLLDTLQHEGPAALIAGTRTVERTDPTRTRWPRFKTHDDATVVLAEFAP